MPDLEYKSPRTGRVWVFTPDDSTKEPTDRDYDWISKQVEQIETDSEQSALGAFGSAVGQGLATMPGTVLQGVGAMVGSTGLEEAGKYSAQQAREAFPIDPLRREDFTTKAGQAVGQAIGQLGLAVGTGGGSIGTGLVLGTAAAMGAASGSERAEQSGLTGARRMGRVYGSALTELASERLFGLGSKTFFKPAAIPTTFGQKGLRFAGTSAGEGVEEIAAGVGNNIVDNVTAAGLDIPTPDIVGMNAFKSYAEQGLLGMVGGTVFAGAQLALGSQAAATPVTRAYAMVDGVRMEVTDLSPTQRKDLGIDEATVEYESILPTEDADIASGIQNKNVRDMFTEMKTNADAKSLDDALNLGAASSVLATAMGAKTPAAGTPAAGTPAAAVTPAPTQAPIVSTPEEAMTSTGAPTPVGAPAAAAADITEFPADGVTNLVDLSNLRFTGTPTQTPTFNATLQGDFTENRVQERVQTNEGGTPTEAGRGDSTVERGQVEQAVAENEAVAPPPAVEPGGEGLLNVIAPREKGAVATAADELVKGIGGKLKPRARPAAQAASPTAPAAAPAAPTEIPVPQAPASPQAIVNSIPEITATITGETTGTGSTVPEETISLQSEGGPTGSLPAAESPMTRVSGGLGAVEPGAPATPAAAPATPAAAVPTGAPAAAAAPAAATTATEEAPPEEPEAVDPNNYKTGDSKDIFVEPDKKLFSQFFGEDNPYSLKEKQSDEMLRNEFVRKYLVDGRSKTTQQKTDEMYELMDTLRSRKRLEAQRQQNIAIDPKYGNYDAVPAVQLAEIYLYASRLNDGGEMLRYLKSVGSLFYYSYEGTGRSAARGLNAISHFVRKINIAKARDIHAKGQSENAGKKMGVGKTDLLDLQNFADGATIKAEDLSQGLSEVTANGKSLDNGLPNLITSAVTPAAEPLVTEADLDPQVAAEAASAAEAANVERAQTESRGLDPDTNTEIGDTIYTANPEPKSPNAPKVTPAQARIIVTQTLGFTPKNVAFEDTDVPNEDGDQYAGKVNKSTKQITINLRNINDSTHLKDVLFEEMDHLVYADPMVQAEIALLAENLPEDIRQEVRQYRPEFQREEATIRFMRRLEQEPNTASLWKKFVDAVRAAIRRLFNGQLTTRDLKMAADRVAARSFQAMAAQTFLAGQGGGMRYSFAGEQSLQNLAEEKRKFMTDSLDAAKAMAAAGKSSEEIRAVTGWFPGFGKGNEKLRWEIPDNDVVFRKDEYFNERNNNEEARFIVSRFFEQKQKDRLEEALSRVAGAPRDVLIAESRKLAETNKQESKQLNAFYAGEGRENKVNNRVPLGYILDHPALFEAYPELNWVPVSFNPKDVDVLSDGQFSRSTGVIGLNPLNTNKDILSTLLHEIQHVIQSKENFASGGNPASMVKMFDFIGLAVNRTKLSDSLKAAADLQDTVGTFTNETVAALPQDQINIAFSAYDDSGGTDGRWKTSSELRTEAEKIDDSILDIDITGYESYQRIAGEYEARDVQARQNLTPEQRKATAPYSSENIAKEDAIVMFGSAGPQMSITPESQRIDQEYLAAVEAGDMETAQRLVDESAYNAGFRKKGYHGTHSDFTVFDRLFASKQRVGLKLDTIGSWFTDSANTAKTLYGPKVVQAYLNLKNPLRFDGVGGLQNFRDEVTETHGSVENFRKWANQNGYDGVEISGDFVDGELQTIRIAFDPNQIKSAEPITRDDAGNIIPPSKRFQKTSDDIRYSLPNPNQPAPEAPDLGPNIFTEEASALAATSPTLQAKIKARPAPNVAKAKADPNIEFTKSFIAAWDRASGKEKADAKPKEKIPAKEVISEFTSLPKKGKGYALTDTGRDAFLTALNQKLVDLGVPSDLAFEATRRAWATYSTKKQKNIDAKALAAAKKDIREQQRLAKKTADQAQAALDKPTNTAKDYLKPAAAPKGPAVQDPVRKALRDAEKIPRIGAAFNSSPEARNAFMTGLSSKLISLGVDQQTAWAAANKAWSTYQTNLADKVTALRKDIENNKMSSILARELKKIPVYQQNDIQYVREYMKNILVFGGLAEDVADAAATLYINKYVDLMKQTKVKAAEKFIESESGAKIKKKIASKPTEYDKLMEAVRLGVTDQSFTAALAFTAPSKFQAFTQADHDRMVALEEEIQDPDTPNLIKVQKVNELMKLADSRMNDINALNVFTGYLVNNTLSGIGTAAIQVFTPFYSMGTRWATDGVRGLMTKDPQRFIASTYAIMDAADTVTAEFKYSFGNDVFRRGQQAELRTLTDLRKVLDNNLKIYQTTTNGLEKMVAASKIALASPDYVRRLYSAMDTASQSLFINQIKVVGIYDAMKKNGMSLKKFKDMLDAKRTFRDAYTITLRNQGGYTENQIRLIAEDAAMNDFGEQVATTIGQGGAETIADVYKMAELEGPSEIGVAESVDGHVIPFLLDVLDSIKSSGDRAAGQGAGDLAFRLVVGYPTTALKVLNRSLYFFPPTAVVRMILNKRYENQADFDPEAPRKYEMLRTESQKHQRMAELVTGSLATIILMALIMDERDKEEKDRRFAVHNLGPSDRAAKQAWRAAGNVAQSIQWRASETSPWISVSWAKAGLESLAPVLALVGTVYDSRDEIVDEGKMADHALNVAGGVMGVFNRPLSGLNDIGEILSGEKNSISQKSLASYTAFRASGLVPFSSLLKTYNRTQGPRDLSTATSTMMAQIPIAGPSLTEPGINLFGDPLGATPNELTYKLPILPVQVGLRQQDVPFYEKILSKGQYPPLKLRTTFEKTYGPVTDSVWRQYVEKRGQMVKKLIIDRWTDLDTLSPEIYDKVLGKFAEAADETVIQELKIQRVPKPVIK